MVLTFVFALAVACGDSPAQPDLQEHIPATAEPVATPTENLIQEQNVLTVQEARDLLNEVFGDGKEIAYRAMLDRNENDIRFYCFEISFINSGNVFAYAWVNSITGAIDIEEVEQESVLDVVVDIEGWVTLEVENMLISIPPTWEYEYGRWGSLNFSSNDVADPISMGLSEFLSIGDIVDSTGRFMEVVYDADSFQEFVFNDGHIGFKLENPTHISWVRDDTWMHLSLIHDGARSCFTNNEAIITAIARTLTNPFTNVTVEMTQTEDTEPINVTSPDLVTITSPFNDFRLSIPSTWSYQARTFEDGWQDVMVLGDAFLGTVYLYISGLTVGHISMLIEDDTIVQEFVFNDGTQGYMLETPRRISWIHDSWMSKEIFFDLEGHGGNRAVFTNNEDLILGIVRSLTYP